MGLKFVDMFCGIGTMRMGFEEAGWECVYSIEWDKHKRRMYNVIFGKEPEGADIRAIRHDDIPRADCWTFGAPCQDFSIAGNREGLEGDRSSLVREVFRLVRETKEEYRPQWLLYENVKGMLSSNKGLDYLEILIEMESLGYDIEWQLLNSKDFGIPQNRERVFTLGHLRGRSGRKIFPITESGGLYNETGENKKTLHETALCLTASGQSNWTGSFIKQLGNIMPTATRDNPNQGRVYDITGISPGLNKMEGGRQQPFIQVKAVSTPERLEKRQNGRRFKELGEPMFTLTKQDIHGVKIQDRIRRLTPRECMRLQGISDKVTDQLIAAKISDTQIYKGAGDACTVNVIYEIAKRLK